MTRIVRGLLPVILALVSLSVAACDDDAAVTPTPSVATATATAPATPTPPEATETPPPPPSTPTAAATPDDFDPRTVVTVPPAPNPLLAAAVLTDVRIGAHEGFDRIVFEFSDARPEAEVRYLEGAFFCGSGAPVDVDGRAIIQVRLTPAVAHDEAGELTIDATELPGTGATILEAVESCDFEADVTWVVGVASRRPFEVVTADDPTRLVIDVQH